MRETELGSWRPPPTQPYRYTSTVRQSLFDFDKGRTVQPNGMPMLRCTIYCCTAQLQGQDRLLACTPKLILNSNGLILASSRA